MENISSLPMPETEAEAQEEIKRLLAEMQEMSRRTRANQEETARLREETWKILNNLWTK